MNNYKFFEYIKRHDLYWVHFKRSSDKESKGSEVRVDFELNS
jgi:hypothetical protein